jgi:methylenetetrahydrofolate reductase (NADPH)
MHIYEKIRQHRTLSFEVFPPKEDKSLEPLLATLTKLYDFHPDFISCTYGALGSNKGRNLEVVESIQQAGVCEALSHFTCVGNTCGDVLRSVEEYRQAGVQNLLALRGDYPIDATRTRGDFAHANELISYISENAPMLGLAAACYPEKHLLADSLESDVDALLKKQDAGAQFFMSQLCYSVGNYLRFIETARKRGVTVPIIVGVLPILNADGLVRMTLSNGCSIPAEVAALIGRYGEDEASFRAAGHAFTVDLVRRYLNEGVSGIHLYTLNRYEDVANLVADAELTSFE